MNSSFLSIRLTHGWKGMKGMNDCHPSIVPEPFVHERWTNGEGMMNAHASSLNLFMAGALIHRIGVVTAVTTTRLWRSHHSPLHHQSLIRECWWVSGNDNEGWMTAGTQDSCMNLCPSRIHSDSIPTQHECWCWDWCPLPGRMDLDSTVHEPWVPVHLPLTLSLTLTLTVWWSADHSQGSVIVSAGLKPNFIMVTDYLSGL